jgi:hypothetical protein
MSDRDQTPLSELDMQSSIDAAFAAVLKRAPGQAMTFESEALKFSGAIHVKADGDKITFTVVDRQSRN